MFHALLAKLTGKNFKSTPPSVIVDQMNEPRPLPMGRKEFHEWSDRIISGSLIPTTVDKETHTESQKFALAASLLHIGPTESHKPDAYFIHHLRVSAIKQVAVMMGEELKKERAERLAKESEEEEKEDEACSESIQ